MAKYISAWKMDTGNVTDMLESAIETGEIKTTDTIWTGPSGDCVIAADPIDIDGYDEYQFSDYSDTGTVAEWIEQGEQGE